MWYIALSKGRFIISLKRKTILFFEEIFLPITISQILSCAKKAKIIPLMAYSCQLPIGWYSSPKIRFHSHFTHFQYTVRQHEVLSLQQWYWVVSRLWTEIYHSECEWSGPGNDNEFSIKSCASLDLVIVSKTRCFGQSLRSNPNRSQPARNTRNEGWGCL